MQRRLLSYRETFPLSSTSLSPDSMCRLILVLSFALVWFVPATVFAQEEFRHWTTSKGRKSDVRLKFIGSERGQVKLEREDNGKQITMALTGLSSSDRAFVRSAMRKTTAPNTTGNSPVSTSNIVGNSASASGDWPQWRGPNRDGKSPATGLVSEWPSGGPELLWNVTGLGEGYSTPAVVGDVIYVLGSRGDNEFVFALSLSDGSPIWQAPMGTKSNAGGFKGPKGTPTIDGDKIYAIGSDGTLVCVSRSGQSLWRKSLRNDFGGQVGHWEYAESPLVDGEKLICTPGGSNAIVALRKTDGTPIWRSAVAQFTGNDFAKAGYASTIAASIGGTPQYIAFLHGGVVGVDAGSGAPLWHYDAPANGTANCSTPVVQGDSVFAASAYGTGGGLAKVFRQGRNWNINEVYFIKKMENHHGGFVLHDGHIFGTNNSVLLCIDWATGNIKWQDRCVGKGSTTFADGHLYVRGEGGEVALVEATAQGFKEKGRFSQTNRSGKNAWAHPVVAAGKLFLHDQDRLLCYSLK